MAIKIRRDNVKERGMELLKAQHEGNNSFETSIESVRDQWVREINDYQKDLMKELKSADIIDDLQFDDLKSFSSTEQFLSVLVSVSQSDLMKESFLCAFEHLSYLCVCHQEEMIWSPLSPL